MQTVALTFVVEPKHLFWVYIRPKAIQLSWSNNYFERCLNKWPFKSNKNCETFLQNVDNWSLQRENRLHQQCCWNISTLIFFFLQWRYAPSSPPPHTPVWCYQQSQFESRSLNKARLSSLPWKHTAGVPITHFFWHAAEICREGTADLCRTQRKSTAWAKIKMQSVAHNPSSRWTLLMDRVASGVTLSWRDEALHFLWRGWCQRHVKGQGWQNPPEEMDRWLRNSWLTLLALCHTTHEWSILEGGVWHFGETRLFAFLLGVK